MKPNNPAPENITNQVFLQGTIDKEPLLKKTKKGSSYCSFSVATEEPPKDPKKKNEKHIDWHKIKAWGKMAEEAAKNFRKGDLVKLKGKLKTSSFEKDGTKQYITSVELTHIRPV
jgi:single-strand DNA-binding protein